MSRGVSDVPGDDQRAAQGEAGRNRVLREFRPNLVHWPVQVDRDDLIAEFVLVDLGQVLRRVLLELFQKHAMPVDPPEDLPVGRAGDAESDGQRGAVSGQADDPHVVREILAAELGADADPGAELEDLPLHLEIPEGAAKLVAGCRQIVEGMAGRELQRLHRRFGRGAADDEGDVVRRAGGGAQGAELLVDEVHQRDRVQDRFRLLIEKALVRRASALRNEQEAVLVAACRVKVDLRRQVRAGVLLLVHRQRRHLGVAEVPLLVGVEDAAAELLLVVEVGVDVLSLVAEDDRGARVLAAREYPAGGDVRVLEQLHRDEAVVRGRLRVVQDAAQLFQVAGPKEMGDVVHRVAGDESERLGFDVERFAACRGFHADMVRGDEAVRRLLAGVFEGVLVAKVRHVCP